MLALLSAYWPMIAITFVIGVVTGRWLFWPAALGKETNERRHR